MSNFKLFNDFLHFKQVGQAEVKQNKIYIPPQIGEVNWRHVYKLKKSVIPKIYFPVILITGWSVFLKFFYDKYKDHYFIKYMFFPPSLLTYLGLVLSLLLVFRNNSAYDRFYEGRKAWGSILNNARNLSRHIWVCIDIDENDPLKDEKINLKKGVMRLIVALVISIRHSLRGEYGWDYDDLSELVKHVPRFNSLFTTAPIEVLKVLPLEIAYHIEGFLFTQKGIPTPMLNQSFTSLKAIIDNFTTCERILNSPIPVIYGIHIKHALLIYLLTLPLQIMPSCSWATIFIAFLTSFTLFGIEAISSEIENPFGRDRNDLKLDDFCQQVSDEINGMMKYFPSSVGFVDWFECEDIADPIIVDDGRENSSSSITVEIKEGSESSLIDPSSDHRSMKKNKGKFPSVKTISKLAGKIPFKGKGKGRKDFIKNDDMKRNSTHDSMNSEITCINGSTSNSNIQNYGSMNSSNNTINTLNKINLTATGSSGSGSGSSSGENTKPPVVTNDDKKQPQQPQPHVAIDVKTPEKNDTTPPKPADNKDVEEKTKDKKPEVKEEKKPEVKEEKKPEVKEDKKPEVKEDKKPEVKEDKKPEVKEDKKPEVKEEKKPEVKEDKKPEVKEDKKPEVKK